MDWKGILSLGALALIGGGIAFWVWRNDRKLANARRVAEESKQAARIADTEREKVLADKNAKELSDDEAYDNFISRRGTRKPD